MDAAINLHILALSVILLLSSILIFLIKNTFLKRPHILAYKMKSKVRSIFIVTTYIGVFIIFFYFLRLYNMHRFLDLKGVYLELSLGYEITRSFSLGLKIYLMVTCILCLLILFMLLLSMHRYARKEGLKLFIYYSYNDYLKNKDYTAKIFAKLDDIGFYDVIRYFLLKLSNSYSEIEYCFFSPQKYKKLFKHRPYVYGNIIILSRPFKYLINFSPILFVVYDCLFNDFVISHVYYWLLFFIPMKLFQRVTTVCGWSCDTMMGLLWEIYYKEESCIYAINEKIQGFLDSYLHSGVRKNMDLIPEASVYFKHYIRFICIADPAYKTPFELPLNWDGNKRDPEKRIFINEESVLLYKNNKNKLIEMVHSEREEDLGKMFWGQEWILLVDKMDKGFIKSEPSYTAELNNVYKALRY